MINIYRCNTRQREKIAFMDCFLMKVIHSWHQSWRIEYYHSWSKRYHNISQSILTCIQNISFNDVKSCRIYVNNLCYGTKFPLLIIIYIYCISPKLAGYFQKDKIWDILYNMCWKLSEQSISCTQDHLKLPFQTPHKIIWTRQDALQKYPITAYHILFVC